MTLFSNFSIDEDLKETLKSQGIHIPEYNIFEDENAFQFEEKTYVNENLIPVVEFKITVNKEALQDHRSFWKELFAHHYGKILSGPPKWDSVLMERYLRENIVNKFRKFILQPVLKLQEEVLKDEDISKLS
jgi:predicted metal-binding protein